MERYLQSNFPCFLFTLGHIRMSSIEKHLGHEVRLGPNLLYGRKETGKTTMLNVISTIFPLKKINGKYATEKENELSMARFIQEITTERDYLLFDQPRIQEHCEIIGNVALY